jgi:uncharacterized protein YndB with AHSA1/START domain
MLKKALIAIIMLALLLVVVGFLLPAKIHVERSAVIDAPPAVVFDLIDDFHDFNRWSPWAQLDPATRYTFEGPESGVGHRMLWQSDNRNVGSGSQEIIESVPDTLLRTHLDFGAQGVATASFRLEPTGKGTHVTWDLDTDVGSNLPMRYFGLFMDHMVGPDYEKGLDNLKRLAEQPSAQVS